MHGLNFNLMGREYQNISNGKDIETVQSDSLINSTRFGFLKSKYIWIVTSSIALFTILCLSLFVTPFSNAHRYVCLGTSPAQSESLVSLQAHSSPSLQSGGYCKVSCSDPCSTFPSVYGNLCCDWNHGSDGGKSCGLHISKDNVCACGGVTESDKDNSEPVPVMSPVREPSEKKEKKKNDGWEPMPWLPFKPFKPISVPDDAEECKQHCDNPCSWSQSNGITYCCEAVPGKSCSTTQVNGKCYCA